MKFKSKKLFPLFLFSFLRYLWLRKLVLNAVVFMENLCGKFEIFFDLLKLLLFAMVK